MTVLPFKRDRDGEPAADEPQDAPDLIPADDAGEYRPVLPAWMGSLDELRLAVRQHTGRHWHATAYHSLRFPAYLFMTLWYAQTGARRLVSRLMRWWHVPDMWLLESQAVAAGRAGHSDAMRAHLEGKKTRATRGRIVAVTAAAAFTAVLMGLAFLPWQAWPVLGAAAVLVLSWHGKPRGQSFITSAAVPARYEPPTPAIITRALGSLQISGIDQVLKDGRELNFITDPHRDGEGWGCDLDLPYGVTARMILEKRERFASGLRRPLSAVWPEPVPHEHEGRLRIWVGFQDMAKVKPKPWPLLRAGQADIFGSVPFGTDPRGRNVPTSLFETNWIIGAAPGQGKTATVRELGCAAALDPITDIWIHELAGKADLEPLAQVCHRYVSGLGDESIAYAAQSLRLLRGEFERRSGVFKRIPKEQRPDGKLTRELAAKRSLSLRPIVAFFDEAQNLFMHPEYGKQAADDAAYIIRMGRAYGIIIVLSTQRPAAESVPTSISGIVTARFCLRVPDQPANDMILGTGSYRAGYKATVFRAKTDAGLGWLKGDEEPQVVKTYYLDLNATERIAKRARAMREQAGVLSGYALGEQDEVEERSFAADVLAVFGDDGKLWSSTICGRLREHFPDVYPAVTAAAVSSQLREAGIEVKQVRQSGGSVATGCERQAVEEALRDA